MSSINLLPEEKRTTERDIHRRRPADTPAPVAFSKPGLKDQSPTESVKQPSRWQQYLGKLFTKPSVSSTKPLFTTPSIQPVTQASILNPATVAPAPRTNSVREQLVVATPVINKPPAQAMPLTKPAVEPTGSKVGARGVTPTPPTPPLPPAQVRGVNLIPSTERPDLPRRTLITILAFGAAAIAVVLLVYVGLVIYRSYLQKSSSTAQAELVKLQQQLEESRRSAEQALTLQLRVNAVNQLLSQRLDWLPLFAFLERTTLSTVAYESLAADAGGKVTLTGSAVSFTDVAKQMRVLENSSEVQQVEVSGLRLQLNEDNKPAISFSFTLSLTPRVFTASDNPIKPTS